MDDLFRFPDFPSDRADLVMHRTPLPRREEGEIGRLAELWGVRGEVDDQGTRVVLREGEQTLEVFHASDSIWWSRRREMVAEHRDERQFATEDEAIGAAGNFLERRGIVDERASVASVTYTEVMKSERSEEKPQSVRVAQHVNYAFQLEGLPFFGPGAKIQVTFDCKEVSFAYRFWREPVADHTRRVLGEDEALEAIRKDTAFADLDANESQVAFDRVSLGYYVLPAREIQGFLIPVFAFEGTVSTPHLERYDFVRYLVAVPFSADEVKSLGAIGTRAPRLFS